MKVLSLSGCFLLCWSALAALADEAALRDLDTHCPFVVPESLDAWTARAQQLELQARVGLGLYPALELDPVQADIYGAIERDGYTIEKVTFDSLPGFKVTGNLYRPAAIAAGVKVPAILCPHGHWSQARFYSASPKEIKQLLASGAERFESAAENHIQARCVQLARMGCIVFHWDMIGYCDSTQISFERAHRFANQPSETEVTEAGWLLFSPLAESHAQSILGMQSLATSRAVDMLLSLPEVDPQRIAITGASGGGTQSFLGAALDDRIRVAFPAVMVSTGMQGGCTCENASWLRTGSGNVEIAALIAPRPLGLTAADDWTRNMANDGYPELQRLYAMRGAPNNVKLFPAVHFGHNFNHVSRVHMYGWMNEHLHLGFETPILERDFELAKQAELSVWDAEHPQPRGGEDFERELMSLWAGLIDSQLQGLLQGDRQQLAQLAEILDRGWQVCLGLTTSPLTPAAAENRDGAVVFTSPADGQWTLASLSSDAAAKPDAFAAEGIAIELGAGGDRRVFVFAGMEEELQPLVANPRLAAAYTYGYNLPQFAKQSRRLGLTLDYLHRQYPEQTMRLSAAGGDAALAAAGIFCCKRTDPSDRHFELAITPGEFRFASVQGIRDPYFLPGSAKYWDLPGLVASLRDTTTTMQADQQADAFVRLERLVAANGSQIAIP